MTLPRRPETGRQSEVYTAFKQPSHPLTQRQRDILSHSDFILTQANRYFFGKSVKSNQELALIRSKLSPLTTYLLTDEVRKKLPNVEVKDIPKIYETNAQTFISCAINEGLTGRELEDALQGWLGKRLIEIALLKNQQISLTEDPQFKSLRNEEKLDHIIIEVKRNGILPIDHFYQDFPALLAELRQIEDVNILEGYFDRCRKNLQKDRENVNILERLRIEYVNRLQQLNQEKQGMVFVRDIKDRASKSEEFKEAFKTAIDYLRYCTPESEINEKSIKLAERLIERMDRARGVMTKFSTRYATSEILAQFFWAIRCGRGYDITKLETLGVSKKTLEKYLNYIFDQRLRTEAAAFWLEKHTDELPNYQFNPNSALIYAIKSLLDTHQKTYPRKDPRNLRITIIVADKSLLKLSISPEADIYEVIRALQQASRNKSDLTLTPVQKYSLKRESYKLKSKSDSYQELSRHRSKQKVKVLGIETRFKTTKQDAGDYAVRIMKDPSEDSSQKGNSPFNLYFTGNHKALVNIDLYGKKGVDIGIKFSHRYFDGRPAQKFFGEFFREFNQYRDIDFDPEKTQPILAINFEPPTTRLPLPKHLPLFEASTTSSQIEVNSKNENDKSTNNFYYKFKDVRPIVGRSAVLALANGVTDLHLLYSSNINPHTEGPFDNVQPVIISLHPILPIYKRFLTNSRLSEEDKKKVKDWIVKTNQAIELAQKGLSTVAVLSAPAGTHQDTTYQISKQLHAGTKLLKTSSMVSPLVDTVARPEFANTEFGTAKSDAYDQPIDLSTGGNSLGVIGFSLSKRHKDNRDEDQAVYTVRKSPRQAQGGFYRFVVDDLNPKNKKRALLLMGHLVNSWDDFIYGKFELERYNEILNEVFGNLYRDGICKKGLVDLGLDSPQKFQQHLNTVLVNDARETVNLHKIDVARRNFYRFLEAI